LEQKQSTANNFPVGYSRENPSLAFKPNYMKLLSEKFGEDVQEDGKPMSEDPNPEENN